MIDRLFYTPKTSIGELVVVVEYFVLAYLLVLLGMMVVSYV